MSFQSMAPKASRESTIDLFSDEVLRDPYPHYTKLREMGPAVYLHKWDAWALTEYSEVHRALSDWRIFSSTDGPALSPITNAAISNSPLAADPPAHRAPRRILQHGLSPMAVREQAPGIQRQADELVGRLVTQGRFDAVRELSQPLALSILAEHFGLPTDSLDVLADWSGAAFDVMGPDNERTEAARAYLGKVGVHLLNSTTRERLASTGVGQTIYAAGDRGELTPEACTQLIAIYLLASVPTSTAATSSAVWFFARHQEQWEALRRDPSLMAGAVEEILRLESPIRLFSRVLREDCEIDGAEIPNGARVLVLYGAANRDPKVWQDPDAFDITRPSSRGQLAFGHGLHGCMGQGLARVHVAAVLGALLEQVEHWRVDDARWKLNNIIRGLDSLPVAVNRAGSPRPLAPYRALGEDAATDVTAWPVRGMIGLARLGQCIALPVGASFSGSVDIVNGTMRGSFEFPPMVSVLHVFGFRVRVCCELIPTDAFDGEVTVLDGGRIDIRARCHAVMYVRPFAFGRRRAALECRTRSPIEIPLDASATMNLDYRPTFSGMLTIPRFTGSGPIAWLVSRLVSGPGNTFRIALDLPSGTNAVAADESVVAPNAAGTGMTGEAWTQT